MARKKKSKENEELLANAYRKVEAALELFNCSDTNDKVRKIILAADDLQTQICQEADEIKIDAYATIKDDYPELGIPKNVWLELVHLRRLQRHTELSEDYIAKIAMSFEGAKNVTAFRTAMLDGIATGNIDNMQVPTCETEKVLQFESTKPLPEGFVELLNDCADKRHHLDSVLWPEMRIYGDAFCHLTGEPYATFNHLLDLWHYRNGGWPKETTPPRIWGTIFRFIREYDMLQQYGFDMAASWCNRMGLKVQRTLPSPTMFKFTENAEKFGKYFMAKLRPDTKQNYPQYRFEDWHHLIFAGDKFFAYVWDTRDIAFYGQASDIQHSDLTTDYEDSCDFLKTSDTEIYQLAATLIPDVMLDNELKPAAKLEVELLEPVEPIELKEITPVVVETAVPTEAPAVPSSADASQLMQEHLEYFEDADMATTAMNTVLQQFIDLHNHPEVDFTEDYDKDWRQYDRCSSIIGEGEVIDLIKDATGEPTGELMVRYFEHNVTLPTWPWHITRKS